MLDFSRPGNPGDDAFIEAFNATVRRECLSQHGFSSLEGAEQTLSACRMEGGDWRGEGDGRGPRGRGPRAAPHSPSAHGQATEEAAISGSLLPLCREEPSS